MKNKKNEIEKLQQKLGITLEEAEELYLFDKATPKEQEEILNSLGIKEIKKEEKTASPINKVKHLKKKKQDDEIKEQIKNEFMEWLKNNDNIILPQEYKNNNFGFMDKEKNFYSFKLTKHKTIQDGYKV